MATIHVKVVVGGGQVGVESPYNAEFVAKAKRLGGRWAKPRWVFDAAQEPRVRALLREVYGTDGSDEASKTVRVRVAVMPGRSSECSLSVGPLQVFRVFGRDSGGRLCPGVVLLRGGIESGGSRKNPDARWGTLVLEAEVPAGAAELVDNDPAVIHFEVVDPGETSEQAEAALTLIDGITSAASKHRAAEALQDAIDSATTSAGHHAEECEKAAPGCDEAQWARACVVLASEALTAAEAEGACGRARVVLQALKTRLKGEAEEAALARAAALPLDQLDDQMAGRAAWTLDPLPRWDNALETLIARRRESEATPEELRTRRLSAALEALVAEHGRAAVLESLGAQERVHEPQPAPAKTEAAAGGRRLNFRAPAQP